MRVQLLRRRRRLPALRPELVDHHRLDPGQSEGDDHEDETLAEALRRLEP